MQIRGWFLLFLFLAATAPAQETPPKPAWTREVVGALNLTQVNFSNWTQGGENAVSWQIILTGKLEYQRHAVKWTSSGKFSFGKTKLGKSDFRKSVDEIRLESVLNYRLNPYINPYLALTAITQFTAGFNYTDSGREKISDFLDPGYFTQSLGFGYEPIKEMKTRLGLALKETITRNFPAPYADDPATERVEKTRTEIGMESATELAAKLSSNTQLSSKLEMFSNLKSVKEIDVNWDNLITAKISKYFNVNFNFRLLYDRNVSQKRQIKQALALGVTYSFL